MSKITQLNEKAWAATVGNNHYDFRFEQSKWVDTGKWILVYKSPFIWTNYGKENWDWEIAFEVKPVILGRPEEITEDQWKEIVESQVYNAPPVPKDDFRKDRQTAYRDYSSDRETRYSKFPLLLTATESGLSLLKSKGLNPETALILIKQ